MPKNKGACRPPLCASGLRVRGLRSRAAAARAQEREARTGAEVSPGVVCVAAEVGALYMLRAPHVSGLQPAHWPPQVRTRARRSASSSSRRMARVRCAATPHRCARTKLRAAVPSSHSALLRRVRAGDAHARQRPPGGHVHRRHQAPVPYPRQDAQESVGEHGAAAACLCP